MLINDSKCLQMSQAEREKMDRLSKKEEKKKALEELNMLFKPVEQKVSKGWAAHEY